MIGGLGAVEQTEVKLYGRLNCRFTNKCNHTELGKKLKDIEIHYYCVI